MAVTQGLPVAGARALRAVSYNFDVLMLGYLFAQTPVGLYAAAYRIVTLPLHKEGLRAAGLHYPGHTEILAERTGTAAYGIMLYAPPGRHPPRHFLHKQHRG